MTNDLSSSQLVDHLFRHEYGKMVAVLSRFLGLSHLDAVEDIVQETFAQALQSWRTSQIPDSPAAWLTAVAKRKAIDYIRKRKSDTEREINVQLTGPGSVHIEELFMENEISDSQLRMIFACCHPALNPKDQIALTLKIVSGFNLKEIAKALRTKSETIKKRIQRARHYLKTNNLSLTIPTGEELKNRLASVQLTIYLLFNEGYYASSTENHIRKELCIEAMRLCKFAVDHQLTKQPENQALLALMCFHASRFESRLDDKGNIILLADQNRKAWDQQLINIGHYHLRLSSVTEGFTSAYHFEAAISAVHARAETFEETDWNSILSLYENLYAFKPTQQIKMNQAVVLLQLNEAKKAKKLLDAITVDENNAVLYHSIAADLHEKLGDYLTAVNHLRLAEQSAPTPAEHELILRKIAKLEASNTD